MDAHPKCGARTAVWLGALIAAGVAWSGATHLPALRLAENWLSDIQRLYVAPAPAESSDIVVIAVTEETLATLPYRSPLNRNLVADIIEKAVAARATALALDVLFDQPTETAADQRLREALLGAAARMPLVVAYADEADSLTETQAAFLSSFTDGIPRGLVNLSQDADDGIVRWRLLGRSGSDGMRSPGFVSALAARLGLQESVDRTGVAPLAYARSRPGELAEFVVFPAHAVTLLPDDWLAGKILFIGADLPHSDRHRTPLAAVSDAPRAQIPGVVVHAHGLNQVLAGLELSDAPWWAAPSLALVLAFATAVAFSLKAALAVRAFVAAGIALVYGGLAVATVARSGLFLPSVAPGLAVILAASIQGGREWMIERRQRAFINDAFSRYLSPGIVKSLINDPGRLRLGGEAREVTYVFTDLASFTSFTERTSPQVLVEVLNLYLDGMCRIALEHEATIDKIVGDAVVAFFGAPTDQPDHAERAVRLALAYDRFSEEFRRQMRARGLEVGVTRVGAHTGPAIVGNFGGNRFFNYTGHGDTVNTAARMESVNKHLGTRLCVSGVTAGRCSGVSFRPIGTLVMVGKTQGLSCFEPIASNPESYAPLPVYLAAFELLAANDSDAARVFAELAQRFPEDPLVVLHAKRLERGETGTTIVMREK